MDERPGLGVEDRRLAALVVERRCMIDRNESLERQELLAQQVDVVLLDAPDERAIAGLVHLERPVVFGQSLVEPDRQTTDVVVDQQVHVFVIDDPEVVETALERQRHVVDGLSRLKEPRDVVARLALIDGLQRLVTLVRLEHQHRGRRRRRDHGFWQDDAKRLPELLQPLRHLAAGRARSRLRAAGSSATAAAAIPCAHERRRSGAQRHRR